MMAVRDRTRGETAQNLSGSTWDAVSLSNDDAAAVRPTQSVASYRDAGSAVEADARVQRRAAEIIRMMEPRVTPAATSSPTATAAALETEVTSSPSPVRSFFPPFFPPPSLFCPEFLIHKTITSSPLPSPRRREEEEKKKTNIGTSIRPCGTRWSDRGCSA